MSKIILPEEKTPGETKGDRPQIDFHQFSHLKVTNSRVMIVPFDIEYSDSKIITQQEDKHSTHQGIVVAIGPGYYLPTGELVQLPYALGDVVFFSDGVGLDFKVRTSKGLVKVKTVGVESIHYVDGTGHELYDNVTSETSETDSA